MPKPKTVVLFILSALIMAALVFVLIPLEVAVEEVTAAEVTEAYDILTDSLADGRYMYRDFLEDHKALLTADGITPDKAFNETAVHPQNAENGEAVLGDRESAVYTVNVPSSGLYSFSVDSTVMVRSFMSLTLSVTVNGETQYSEADNIDLPIFWQDETKEFPMDKFGDEIPSSQITLDSAQTIELFSNPYISHTPLLFYLTEGDNIIEITNETSQQIILAGLTARPNQNPPDYAAYIAAHQDAPATDAFINIDATDYTKKNSSYIQLYSSDDPASSPVHPVNKKINTLFMEYAGNEVYYTVDVAQSGLYRCALRSMISNDDFANFCSLKVDGAHPFKEAASFPLTAYSGEHWHNRVWGGADGPYYIYLSQGTHTISFRMELEPIAQELRDLQLLVDHINQFSLDIMKITGKEPDKNRTWRLTRYIPETAAFLDAYDAILRGMAHSLSQYSTKGVRASVLSDIVTALALLDKLREEPDELPLYMENLSGETVSVLKLSSEAMDQLYAQGIIIDQIYLCGGGYNEPLPKENAGLLADLSANAQRVWASYTSPKYAVREQENALNIWVNQSVFYVDAMQKLADTRFTPETGIAVNFSIVPVVANQANKLILSASAGTTPDIALGLESYMPYDLASRGALVDLTGYPDFWETAAEMVPGAFVSYIYNEGVYAIPESVNFHSLVYREDIFRQLGLEPPDTWDDVRAMMSELQRYNMSFYLPIATGDGYKWFYQTTPLIYQHGGRVYADDGSVALNEPNSVRGITALGELFTTYALAEQVPVFFSSFRYGLTPVGIIDAANYMLFKRGAPELTGQWSLASYPGVAQDDGSVARWYVANGRGGIIFKDSQMRDESWEFLKWWMSEEIQNEYAFSMLANYGALWLSANMDALRQAPMEDEALRVMMDSIQWMRDVPRSPGQYMLERSLSDIWNTIVFDGTPAQVAVDIRAIEIQREIRRKMTEFGLMDAYGAYTGPYVVRELDWVLEKMNK
jgi:ABC-type glycerol-3-phosphate transport system substrate-binding protein